MELGLLHKVLIEVIEKAHEKEVRKWDYDYRDNISQALDSFADEIFKVLFTNN